MRIMNFKNDVCDDKYFSLFAIKAEAEKIHNLALQLEIDQKTKEEWRQYVVLCNLLIDQLKHKSHIDAIRDLKMVFGGARGLNPENEKLAKKILKASNASASALMSAPAWQSQNHMVPPMMMGPHGTFSASASVYGIWSTSNGTRGLPRWWFSRRMLYMWSVWAYGKILFFLKRTPK